MKTTCVRFFMAYVALIPVVGGMGWTNRVMAAVHMTVPASLHSIAIATPEHDYLDQLESAHNTLFGSFDMAEFHLKLNTPITSAGTYSGTSVNGSPFELKVIFVKPLQLSTISGITQQHRDDAAAMQLSFKTVVAMASTSNGSVGLTGLVVSGMEQGILQTGLILTTNQDLSQEMFQPLASIPPHSGSIIHITASEIMAIAEPQLSTDVVEVIQVIDPSTDCLHCSTTYEQSVDIAEQAYNDKVREADEVYKQKVNTAEDARRAALTNCRTSYDADVRAAYNAAAVGLSECHATLVAGLIACAYVGTFFGLLSFGIALAICVAAAHVAYASCTALETMQLNSALSAAKTAYNLCVQTAENTYQIAVHGAMIEKLQKIINAMNEKALALSAVKDTYEACLAACASEGGDATEDTAVIRYQTVDLVVGSMN